MSKHKSLRPSPGVVLGALALIVAVVGQASAASTTKVIVRKGEIANGAVSAKALAKGAVHPKAIAAGAVTEAAIKPGAVGATALRSGAVDATAIKPGAVTAPALAGGAVSAGAIAPDAVGPGALAPGSVYGGALEEETVHSAALKDEDATADLSTWTASSVAIASCGPGERVLSGGIVFTNAGNRRVGVIQSAPYENGAASGWVGQFTSDSGGTATAEVQALCLK